MPETTDAALNHLRIPYNNIKFGQKLESHGYGTVLTGEVNGQRVALKRLNITNLANIKPKLLTEILTISQFRHHPNLVALVGFCDEKSNEIILVYEYVSEGNLADKMIKKLSTIQRFEICLGAARGLEYLHTSIVHGNIKLSKILLNLDENTKRFVAKVSSFGLSKIVPGMKSLETVDEEDVEKVTKESDVYAFGVILLEVLCGVSELVDTDDYVEKHVTVIVPKKRKGNEKEVRSVVHRDIRKEVKMEALETYVKIACECVVEDVDARPTMGRVVEELEKALRLQGGEVTYVQLPGNNLAGANDDTFVDDGSKDDDSGVTVESNVQRNEPEEVSVPTIEEDVKDLKAGGKLDDAGEDNGDEVSVVGTVLESSNGEKITVDVEATDTGSVPNETHIEDAKNEISNNNEPETTEEILNNLSLRKESNITVENEEEKSEIPTVVAIEEMSTVDPETTEETIDDIDSNKESNIIEENNEDDQTSTSTKQEVQDSGILKSDRGYFNEESVENEEENKSNNEMITTDSETTEETKDDFDSDKKSNPTEENNENDKSNGDTSTSTDQEVQDYGILKSDREYFNEVNESKISIEDAHKEMSTTDLETNKETIDDFDSNKISTITEENKENEQSIEMTTTSESSNGDTSISINQEVQDTSILKSNKVDFNEATEDKLNHLRIPFNEIKFGQQIDIRGYGTMFEGEYNHKQVALKRLNITNLGTIKPKLLSAIVNIYRFHQHPNLVALIGFCDENNKEVILVYEYVSGGNLKDKMSKHLTTIQRLQICLGVARGLEYLHTGFEFVDSNAGIIHGDIKLSKILLTPDSAKLSGFGLPKLLPGQVEIVPRSLEQLTKEGDVYTFGVVLLEVLCGVRELVDTDDYVERHVSEVVPKRLEQNTVRKIVHFDIRDEIRDEALETYARIACRCVVKEAGERPTMSEVVVELEKALRLQGGKVSDVQILGSTNGNSLPEVPVGVDDGEGDGNGETMSSDVIEEESKVVEETRDDINLQEQSFPVPNSGSNDVETVPEDAEKENGDNINDHESTEEVTVDLKSNEESKIIGEDEVNSESKLIITSKSNDGNGLPDEVPAGEDSHDGEEDVEKDNGDNINVPESKEENVVDLNSNEESKINEENEVNHKSKMKTTVSSNSNMKDEGTDYEDATKEKDNSVMVNTPSPHIEEIMEAQNSLSVDDNAKTGVLKTEEPELNLNTRDFSYSATETKEPETKRSNSSCSDSSNGDDTQPSDSLLPKSPDTKKKTVTDYGTCGCCCCLCSCWRFICDRVVLYGGQFWNKLVSWFSWITGQCSSKRD